MVDIQNKKVTQRQTQTPKKRLMHDLLTGKVRDRILRNMKAKPGSVLIRIFLLKNYRKCLI